MACVDAKGGCTEFDQLEFMLIQRVLENSQHAIMYFSSAPRNICEYTHCFSVFMHESCIGLGMLKPPADSHPFSSGMKLQTIYSRL